MLWVKTFSVFLPLLFSSSVVWPKTGAAHKPTIAAHIRSFFIICLRPQRLNPPTGILRALRQFVIVGSPRIWRTTTGIPARVAFTCAGVQGDESLFVSGG